MKEFVGLRTNTYTYLTVGDSEHKKSQRNKEVRNKTKVYG